MMDISLHIPLLSPLWFGSALAAFAVGYAAGLVHFRMLGAVAHRLMRGDWRAVLVQVLRMLAMIAVLGLATLAGAQALVAATAGIVLARNWILSRKAARP